MITEVLHACYHLGCSLKGMTFARTTCYSSKYSVVLPQANCALYCVFPCLFFVYRRSPMNSFIFKQRSYTRKWLEICISLSSSWFESQEQRTKRDRPSYSFRNFYRVVSVDPYSKRVNICFISLFLIFLVLICAHKILYATFSLRSELLVFFP